MKGWNGTAAGFKFEPFRLHEKKDWHLKCVKEFVAGGQQLTNAVVPEMKAWKPKISEHLNEQLCNKVIVENWISTEHVASDKYGSLLEAFHQGKSNVGTTHRNRYGYHLFNSVHSDLILFGQKKKFQKFRCFSLGADLGTDKSGRPQECILLRGVDEDEGELEIHGLGYDQVRHANASCCLDSLFNKMQVHGITKEQAMKKWICLGADGASVNMGQYAGVKGLIQLSNGDAGTKPGLVYLGLWWVIVLHCVNHLLELGLKDLGEVEPYIKIFDEILTKVFKIYHFSSQMMLDMEGLAALQDEDFTQLGGLNQIRWAPSQHRAIEKIDSNFPLLCKHLEHIAADRKHKRNAECHGVLTAMTSVKFVKMLMFLLDMHMITKVFSLSLQKKKLLVLEVKPFLQRALVDLDNLKGGKGKHMLTFAREFAKTGQYKGVVLNRVRYETRATHQSRMDEFVAPSEHQLSETDASIESELFKSFDFYVNYVKQSLKERFGPLSDEPLCWFSVFDHNVWPDDREALNIYGDKEIEKLVGHFCEIDVCRTTDRYCVGVGSLQVSGCRKSNPIQNPPSSQKSCCVPTSPSPMPHQRQLRRGERQQRR